MSVETLETPVPPDKAATPASPAEKAPPCKSFADSVKSGMSIDDPMFSADEGSYDEAEMMTDNQDNSEPVNDVNGVKVVTWQTDDITRTEKNKWPSLQVADRVVERLADRWKRSLVVKLFDRHISYPVLLNRLQRLWNPSQRIQLVDLEANYYLVRFSSSGDWAHALLDGPWRIFGTYLLVQPWSPEFDVDQGIMTVTVWVRFPKLPVLWYDKHFLTYLGNLVGTTIKIDLNTSMGNRGKFARVAVAIDINKPLLDRFELNGRWYRIEYEGLPSICFECGCVGHTKDICPMAYAKAKLQEQTEAPNGGRPMVEQVVATEGVSNDPVDVEGKEERYGPWMQVRRNRRNFRKDEPNGETSNKSGKSTAEEGKDGQGSRKSGSRYGVLSIDDDEVIESRTQSQPTTSVHGNKGKKAAANGGVFKFNAAVWVNKGAQGGSKVKPNGENLGKQSDPKTTQQVEKIPITVGPMCHEAEQGEVEVGATRGKNNKMRKMRDVSTVAPAGTGTEARNEFAGESTFQPGNCTVSGSVRDPIFRKPPKNRSGLVLGKRKTDITTSLQPSTSMGEGEVVAEMETSRPDEDGELPETMDIANNDAIDTEDTMLQTDEGMAITVGQDIQLNA